MPSEDERAVLRGQRARRDRPERGVHLSGAGAPGSYITRMGFIFDWIMGVPEEYRARLQPGTGLIFRTPEEWKAIGQIVPIQPHMSDHMIGCPYALENAGWPWRPG